MDYQKVDGQLATEYDSETGGDSKSLPVFVRTKTPLPQEAIHELERLRVSNPDPASAVFTMDLTPKEVAALSDRPWVLSIRSSRKLRPISE